MATPRQDHAARKLVGPEDVAGPDVEHRSDAAGDRWVVRSYQAAREVLRETESVRQAGFGAEQVERAGARMRPPILYLEGAEHRTQRKATARFFAPKVIEGYREMIEELSEQLVARLRVDRPVDLTELSETTAVTVAARVVGLTSSRVPAMARRLDALFHGDSAARRDPRSVLRSLDHRTALLRFFFLDVKPAIRARRRRPQEDVISQLLEQGFRDVDILTECVTYGAAGMATTREFITVAAWHLLDHPELLDRYRGAAVTERLGILEEILRLEPVIGHLRRRTTAAWTLATDQGAREVPAGTLVDLDVRAINADAAVAGADPTRVCPGRELPRSVPPTLMSFGDGHHKCPGGPLALMETEIFLSALFRREIVAAAPPVVTWNSLTQGYELRSFGITLARPTAG
jgi:cytochrome P450